MLHGWGCVVIVDRFEYKQNGYHGLSCSSITKFLKMESSHYTAEASLGGR